MGGGGGGGGGGSKSATELKNGTGPVASNLDVVEEK